MNDMPGSQLSLSSARSVRHKEKKRTECINNAFSELRRCIPNVPSDTKLSKIKTLRLASSYIAHLSDILENYDPQDRRDGREFHAELQVLKARGRQKNFRLNFSHNAKARSSRHRDKGSNASGSGTCFGEKEEVKRRGRTGWPEAVWAEALECRQSSCMCRAADRTHENQENMIDSLLQYEACSPALAASYSQYLNAGTVGSNGVGMLLPDGDEQCLGMSPGTQFLNYTAAILPTDVHSTFATNINCNFVSVTSGPPFSPFVLSDSASEVAEPNQQVQNIVQSDIQQQDFRSEVDILREDCSGKLPSIATLRTGEKYHHGDDMQLPGVGQLKLVEESSDYYKDHSIAKVQTSPQLTELRPVTIDISNTCS